MSYLKKYFAIGLHQSYNSEEMLARLDKLQHVYSLFEDYLSGKSHFQKDFDTFKKEIEIQFYGLELDLESIVDMPSIVLTPSGFSLERVRIYARYFGASYNAIYLHLPEGAPKNDLEKNKVGKSLAYRVSDFLKANKSVVA